MSEVSPKQLEIEAVIDDLASAWDESSDDVPSWVAHELTFGQMRLLFLLNKHGPSPMSCVAEWLHVGLSAASGIVERVERHGLVMRQHRLDDRRIVECALTDTGRGLIAAIAGMRREAMRRTLGVLTDEELGRLTGLIKTILERSKSRAK